MSLFVPAGPPRFKHQRQGLRDIIRNRGVHALLFDPGTGKTATTLDYASLLALKSPTRHARVLVIGPLAAIDTWVDQAPVYISENVSFYAEAIGGSIKQRAEVLVARGKGDYKTGRRRSIARSHRIVKGAPSLTLLALNLDAFASRSAVGSRTMADLVIEAVKRYKPDLIVVDESHRIKGATSNTSRAVGRLANIAPRRIILTGTVMPHSPLDVWGQWRFLDPMAFHTVRRGVKAPMPFGTFKGAYAVTGGWMGKQIKGFVNLDHLESVMALRSTVAKKDDALDLPPWTDVKVRVDLSPAEAKAYREMKDDLAVKLATGQLTAADNRLTQLMRLRQITSGFLGDENGVLHQIGSSRAEVIASLVHDTLAGESRVVVFCHFRPEIDLVRDRLERAGTEVLVVTGDTKPIERHAIRERFGSDDPARLVLVAQTKTMSLAVNELVTASHAIFGSFPNQRDDVEQARARLDRQGQTRPVTYWITLAPGTVDHVLLKSYRERTNLETALLAHIRDEPPPTPETSP